jgi:hypothetical protein
MRRLGDVYDVNNALSLLGSIQRRHGNLGAAEATLQEALRAHEQMGNVSGLVWTLNELAAIALQNNQPERALRLAGAAQTQQGRRHESVPFHVLELPDIRVSTYQDLGASTADEIWLQGQAMTRHEAVVMAVTVPGGTLTSGSRPDP